jgi:hypothetical protein
MFRNLLKMLVLTAILTGVFATVSTAEANGTGGVSSTIRGPRR